MLRNITREEAISEARGDISLIMNRQINANDMSCRLLLLEGASSELLGREPNAMKGKFRDAGITTGDAYEAMGVTQSQVHFTVAQTALEEYLSDPQKKQTPLAKAKEYISSATGKQLGYLEEVSLLMQASDNKMNFSDVADISGDIYIEEINQKCETTLGKLEL